ncbi:hypothetical protein [Gordonia hydrophobica]|uniref:Short chain dehydrogenase n=1 Tax=Gordonia hydrophobica TaxID=40516 RepID=A0ABZ2TYU7_9ACTN|nr:hypothetical protein [Gordonia hydrophobica]MBM7367228.1 NAD(P)-dependent dehydrogenase (short-subunit alcohol dehydrogenase family) [Gordonia hydrophobica]
MSLLTMGFAAEWADDGIACNCLWPETTIATAAAVLAARPTDVTGQCFIDANLVRLAGVDDLSPYGGTDPLEYDFFLDPPDHVATTPLG